jgi:AcrR family transcriptional regulator
MSKVTLMVLVHEAGPVRSSRGGRPRDPSRDDAIRAAILRLLAEVGYGALTMDAVAAEAGVGKATIYRRWAGKKELVIDALATLNDDLTVARSQLPEDSRGRILAILTHLTSRDPDSLTGRITPRMMVYSESQPDLYADYFDRVIMPRRRWLHQILRDGVDRGELRPDLDVEVAALALVGPALMPARGLGLPPGHGSDLGRRLFDVVWPGLAARGHLEISCAARDPEAQPVSSRMPAASERSWSIESASSGAAAE